jgi:hypothetical protein
MTDYEGQIGAVTEPDVRALLEDLKPGAVYPSTELWTRYVRAMDEQGRLIGNRNQLGRALTALGFKKHRTRKTVGGVPQEIHSWIVPGAPPVDEEYDRIRSMIEKLGGDGIYPVDSIWDTYQSLARRHGWRWTLSEQALMSRLTKMGYDRTRQYKGRKTRYLFVRP